MQRAYWTPSKGTKRRDKNLVKTCHNQFKQNKRVKIVKATRGEKKISYTEKQGAYSNLLIKSSINQKNTEWHIYYNERKTTNR